MDKTAGLESMNEQQYLELRLDDQIDWYDKKSGSNQRFYKRLRILEIIAAALIPFLTGFFNAPHANLFRWTVGCLGALVTILSGIILLNKFHERWIEYRTTAETLKHHKFLYLTRTEPYNDDARFNLLVATIEGLISKENSRWSQIHNPRENAKQKIAVS